MILLGSIERSELLALCDWWLSAERRILTQGQSSQGQVPFARISWESFAFVDEEEEENEDDKVYLSVCLSVCLSFYLASDLFFCR